MNTEVETYLQKYPDSISFLFHRIRDCVLSSVPLPIEEKLWAKLPSYYCGNSFVRIIPFKDHINIEASGLAMHADEFSGYKFTPKGMLQIGLKQEIDSELLTRVFRDTYQKGQINKVHKPELPIHREGN